MNTCASSRFRGEERDEEGNSVLKHVLHMQNGIDQLRGCVNSLENKIGTISLELSSMKQQMFQSPNASSGEKGATHAEIDGMLSKHIDRALTPQVPSKERTDNEELVTIKDSLKSVALAEAHMLDSMKRVEQGLSELRGKSQENQQTNSAGGSQSEIEKIQSGTAQSLEKGRSNDIRIQLREEFRTLQANLFQEFRMQPELMQSQRQEPLCSNFDGPSRIGGNLKDASGGEKTIDIDLDSMMALAPKVDSIGVINGAYNHQGNNALTLGALDHLPTLEATSGKEDMYTEQAFELHADERGILIEHLEPDPEHDFTAAELEAQELVAAENEEKKEEAAEELADEHDHTPLILTDSGSLGGIFCCDDNVDCPPYSVEEAYWKTGIAQKIARSHIFENSTVLVVAFNAVYIGVDSDYNNAQNIYEAEYVFQACNQFFCIFFTWELLVRFLAFEIKGSCLKDGWFKFDSFLVSTMILDTWLLMPILYFVGGGVIIPTQPLRMLRLFKLTRMARLMKAFPELVTMIKGLVRSLRAISSSMILIGLMVYVWAIMLHMLMKEEKEFNDKLWRENLLSFETITKCIWTLLMDGTLMLDNAAPLMGELLFSHHIHYVLAGFFFLTYALLSAMLILQMLIGVLCDVVARVGQEQRDATAIGLVKQELLSDLQQWDGGDGRISQVELFKVMSNQKSRALLKKLNINRAFLLELQKMMFTHPGHQVHIKNILELMVMCRGDNPVTVESMAGGLLSIINEVTSIRKTLEDDIHMEVSSIKKAVKEDMRVLQNEIMATLKKEAALEQEMNTGIRNLTERVAHLDHNP